MRRLLGPDYSIVCDTRLQVECIGVHVDMGADEALQFRFATNVKLVKGGVIAGHESDHELVVRSLVCHTLERSQRGFGYRFVAAATRRRERQFV